jgi:SAM-dependent methyltransferase
MNEEQIKYWNGPSGRRWTDHQEALDSTLREFGAAVLKRAAARPGERVLDVGCGCGDSVLALSDQVGPSGSVTGVDVSAMMLARAHERSAARSNVRLIEHDAATFESPGAFDLIFSRFGVMFFEDPQAAFTQLRTTLRPGGRMVFVCWRNYADNPWVSEPADAVRALVPDPPPMPAPGAPGPFAFAEPARLEALLRGAGFDELSLERFDATVALSSGDVDEAVRFVTSAGPAAMLLLGADEATVQKARDALAAKLAPHRTERGLALAASAWLVTAR